MLSCEGVIEMNKHKGFTLIELLIVIVVMGILASMMMLSSSESVSTARASNIITNLRNFSMAAMALYTDSMDTFGKNPGTLKDDSDRLTELVKSRMHNQGDIPDVGKYKVVNNEEDSTNKLYTWWAGYDLDSENSRVREKLEGRAESAKLKGSTNNTPPDKSSAVAYNHSKSKHTYVWIQIRSNRR